MKIIVGLGNPGPKYQKNRHSLGFIILDEFSSKNDLKWKLEKKFSAETAKFEDLFFVKPQTFMNSSGESVAKIMSFYKLDPASLILIHDDVDLPFNKIKVQFGSGAAGHKGVENVLSHLATKEFWRMRIGIGRPHDMNTETEDWVLTDFTDDELDWIKSIDLRKYLDEILRD